MKREPIYHLTKLIFSISYEGSPQGEPFFFAIANLPKIIGKSRFINVISSQTELVFMEQAARLSRFILEAA